MKTTITADGTLTISPENELEAYALSQWCKASSVEPMGDQPSRLTGKMIINPALNKETPVTHYSGHPELIGKVVERMSACVRAELKQTSLQPYMYADVSTALTNSARAVLQEYQDKPLA